MARLTDNQRIEVGATLDEDLLLGFDQRERVPRGAVK